MTAVSPPPDAEIARINDLIRRESAAFYTELAGKTAPGCAHDSNSLRYVLLRDRAQSLVQRAATTPGDRPMQNAAAGLAKAVDAAERVHERASATTADPSGVCMAPGAITLNADAMARATTAIANLQAERSR
ncbi:hypothetical protein U1701_18270 [Sphingomonas sp. PB2P19]|uniref:hypothetical protein n=1 Tax=Sphingomonas rhamnosi TaxID=3096156 RepID=UPI002FCA0159